MRQIPHEGVGVEQTGFRAAARNTQRLSSTIQMIQIRTRPQRPAKSGEGVVEGDRLEVAAAEDIEQLAETVGDGGQVGVANHDLLGLK